MTQHIYVDDTSKLQLHIYVLGYYPMGESILIIVYDNASHKTYKSILIDSFEVNGINYMDGILNQYNINKTKLDIIVWTHPDKDHSLGFSGIIKNYSSKNTLYLLPDGVSRFILTSCKFEFLKTFIRICSKKNIERVNSSNMRKYPTMYGATKFHDGYNDDIEFDIEILTPFASQTFSKLEVNKTHKANDLSISLMVRFGGQNFYFGGDVEDPAIKMIDKERMNNILFVKIPHHGSQTSEYLPILLQPFNNESISKTLTSVTSDFVLNRIKLPNASVINKYIQISNKVLSTSNDSHTNKYGIWELKYNIRPQCIIEPVAHGDASELIYGKE